MKYLNRSLVPEPKVLKKYSRVPNKRWGDMSPEDRREIAYNLLKWQRFCCAYCGCRIQIDRKDHWHIEHFVPLRVNKSKEFNWENLFLACTCKSREYCASYKDEQKNKFRDNDILKPDEQNPDEYLTYDAEIVKSRENIADKTLANNTINRLNLNHYKLREKRLQALRSLDSLIVEIDSLDNLEVEDVRQIASIVIETYGFESMIGEKLHQILIMHPRELR